MTVYPRQTFPSIEYQLKNLPKEELRFSNEQIDTLFATSYLFMDAEDFENAQFFSEILYPFFENKKNDKETASKSFLISGYLTTIGLIKGDKDLFNLYDKDYINDVALLFGEDSDEYVKNLILTANNHANFQNYNSSFSYLERANDIIQRDSKRYDTFIIDLLKVYARVNNELNEYDNEKEILDQIIEIYNKKGKEDPVYAEILGRRAMYKYKNGQAAEALSDLLKSLEIIERAGISENIFEYMGVLGNIAPVYAFLGYNEKAAAIYNRYFDLVDQESDLFKYNEEFQRLKEQMKAEVLLRTSEYLLKNGQPQKALNNIKEAIPIFQKSDDVKGLYSSLYMFALSLDIMKRYDEAISFLKEGLELLERNYPDNTSLQMLILTGLSFSYYQMGDFKQSYESVNKALQIFESRNPENKESSYYITLLNMVLVSSYKARENNEVDHYAPLLYDLVIKQTQENLFRLTEEERETYWNVFAAGLQGVIMVSSILKEGGGLLYDAILANKGLLLNTNKNIKTVIENSNDSELKEIYSQIQKDKRKLITIPENDVIARNNLKENLQKSERTLLNNMLEKDIQLGLFDIKWKDIQKTLGPNDAAIEFVSLADRQDTVMLAALIRKTFKNPIIIKLPYNKIYSLKDKSPSVLYKDSSITELFWADILKYISPGENIYFSPDGILNHFAIEYLPIDDKNNISDKYNIKRLSSTKELLYDKKENKKNYESIVLFGGIDYFSDPEMVYTEYLADNTRGIIRNRFRHKDDLKGVIWRNLPGTDKEMEDISSIMKNSGLYVTSYNGEKGSEESFKSLTNKNYDIIHVATHGFYLPEDKDMLGEEFIVPGQENSFHEDSSLERSGLVFAGVNNNDNILEMMEDGILTGNELSRMNLSTTDLIVMSACQTGLGDTIYDGISGLPRALKKAGVNSILMSLWDVNDEATCILMTSFYENLSQGKSKKESLEEAQKEVRKHTFINEKGEEESGSNPLYWASFILLD